MPVHVRGRPSLVIKSSSLYCYKSVSYTHLDVYKRQVPVGLQVTQVTSAGIGTEAFRFLIVPQREGIVITVGVDNRVS